VSVSYRLAQLGRLQLWWGRLGEDYEATRQELVKANERLTALAEAADKEIRGQALENEQLATDALRHCEHADRMVVKLREAVRILRAMFPIRNVSAYPTDVADDLKKVDTLLEEVT
jgi:hypothetical protein